MNWKKRFWRGCTSLLAVLCLSVLAVCAQAEGTDPQTGTAHGFYRDPALGIIEDSGGESNEALGQSMVENVVKGPAMLETAQDGKTYLSIRFGLMDSISETAFSARYPGQTEWEEITAVQTAKTQDTADFRFAVASSEATLRAEFRVEAMGRSVIFYITADEWSAGNTEGFAELSMAETSDASDDLADVQGLITGEGNAAAQTAAADRQTPTAAETAQSTQSTGEMNLGASVWFMLFCTTFSAVFLAGGCLMLLAMLLRKKQSTVLPAEPEAEEAENTLEPEADDMDLSILFDESSWEEPDDEDAH